MYVRKGTAIYFVLDHPTILFVVGDLEELYDAKGTQLGQGHQCVYFTWTSARDNQFKVHTRGHTVEQLSVFSSHDIGKRAFGGLIKGKDVDHLVTTAAAANKSELLGACREHTEEERDSGFRKVLQAIRTGLQGETDNDEDIHLPRTVNGVPFREIRQGDVIIVSATYKNDQQYVVFVCFENRQCPMFQSFRVNGKELESLNESSGSWNEVEWSCAMCFDGRPKTADENYEDPDFSVAVVEPKQEQVLIQKHGVTFQDVYNAALKAAEVNGANQPRLVCPY